MEYLGNWFISGVGLMKTMKNTLLLELGIYYFGNEYTEILMKNFKMNYSKQNNLKHSSTYDI